MRTSPSIVLAVCAALWTIALVPGSAVGDDPPPEATRVLAFGDSITLGYGDLGVTCDGPAIGYPARFESTVLGEQRRHRSDQCRPVR